jgi:hypothetical protein
MGWQVGYVNGRDVGYGVPAICDHPKCNEEIDRGLSYCCGGLDGVEGETGCGLYFCTKHLPYYRKKQFICSRCHQYRSPYKKKPDTKEWINHKLTHESWGEWRKNYPMEVEELIKGDK